MVTATIYATDCKWGASSFNSTTDLKVGKSSSATYRGRLTFAAVPETWVIRSITLKLRRIDSYSSHTLLFGGSTDSAFGATLDYSFTQSITGGKGEKTVDLTEYAATIQGYGTAWYIHIRHGSGSNSYTEFNGDEDSESVRPQLIIEYEEATVYVYVSGMWKRCLVYYCDAGTWVQCIPYYNSEGTWKQV